MTEPTFIGTTLLEDWEAMRKERIHIPRNSVPLRVHLSHSRVEAFVAEWSYTETDANPEGTPTRKQESSGGHHYVVAASGALLIVENNSTTHDYFGLKPTEIIQNTRIAITYAPGAWLRVTGPWLREAPEKEFQERIYPDRDIAPITL